MIEAAPSDDPAKPSPTKLLRTFAIASLGGMLELYDFLIFVFLAKEIGEAFLPVGTPDWLRQAQVFALFAVGYLVRPIGGIVMAHFGDRSGRKRVFMLSVTMMALPTFVIGCLPTYAQIGLAAPLLLLLVCRMLQGAAVGGEVPGAWVFVAEHAPRARTGLACGLLSAGLTAGILLGAAINVGLTRSFSPPEITAWAWRLPFLLGGVLGLVGMALRRKLAETPVFETLRREARLSGELPLKVAVRDHPRAVAVSMAATWILATIIVVLILLAPQLLRGLPGVDASTIVTAGLAETAVQAVFCVVWEMAIDRFGLRPVVWLAAPIVAVAGYLMFAHAPGSGSTIAIFMLVGGAAGSVTLVPVVMVRAFPAALAFSGVSTSYNASYALAGGLTPPLVAYLFRIGPSVPAYYVALVAAAGCATILWWLSRSDMATNRDPRTAVN